MKKEKNTLNKIIFGAFAILIVGLTTFALCLSAEEVQEPTEPETTEVITTEAVFYDVPLDIDILEHIQGLCADYDLPIEIVLAVIDVESNYKADAVSNVGAVGLMQVVPEYHEQRMMKLNCFDMFDPKQNVTVGIDFLSELIEKYDGNFHKALTAYNYGQKGANDKFFGQGTYQSAYSIKVLDIAQKIEKGMIEMRWTDDPVRDNDRYQEEQEEQLKKLPKCSYCDHYIQTEELCDIEGTLYCMGCFKDNFVKNVEDYIE